MSAKINKLTHVRFAELVMKAKDLAATLQASIDGGKPVTKLAEEWGISPGSMADVLTSAGINHGREYMRPKPVPGESEKLDAVMTALLRLAQQLGVELWELEPFVKRPGAPAVEHPELPGVNGGNGKPAGRQFAQAALAEIGAVVEKVEVRA